MRRRLTLLSLSGLMGFALYASGCGLLLGLGEYEEAATTGAGSASGQGGSGGGGGMGTGGTGGGCEPAMPCYAGPQGTEGVGVCKAGVLCDEVCQGEVLPAAETCAASADEDCDGSDCVLWAKGVETLSYAIGWAITADDMGNTFAAGTFNGTLPLDPANPISVNSPGAYLAKFDPQGVPLWSKGFEHASTPTEVATDAQGNVILAGDFAGAYPVNFGGSDHTTSNGSAVFVAKFSPSGDFVWSRMFEEYDAASLGGVAVDGAGNVILSGASYCEGGCLNPPRVWVRKYDVNGILKGSQFIEAGNLENNSKVTVDPFDNVLVTGAFTGKLKVGNFSGLPSAGGTDVFVVKLDSKLIPVWRVRFGDMDDQVSRGVATDGLGNVIITGNFMNKVNFGGDDLIAAGMEDIFVAQLSSLGAHVWSKSFGNSEAQSPTRIAANKDGFIVLAGQTTGAVDFGGGERAGGGGTELFAAKLDNKGNHVFSKVVGDENSQIARGAALTPAGEALLIGEFEGSIDLGAGPIMSASQFDIFIAKLAP